MGADRVPVGDAKMVGLDAALDENLPVRRPLPGFLVDDLQTAGVQPGEIRGQSAEEMFNVRCGDRFGGNPDPAVGLGAAQAFQAQLSMPGKPASP